MKTRASLVVAILGFYHLSFTQVIKKTSPFINPWHHTHYVLSPVASSIKSENHRFPFQATRFHYRVTEGPTVFDQPGTYFLAPKWFAPLNDTITFWGAPEVDSSGSVIRLVLRRSDTYLGYLEELSGVPFQLAPRWIPGQGHSTDLGLSVDCAELAIYAIRRLGRNVPYCGPQQIKEYLIPVTEGQLRAGDLVHFGDQVSIIWKDEGRIGQLDPEDLLFQSFEDFPKVVSWQASGFCNRPFQVFRWPQFNNE